eukprot:1186398-Rhodomonas_salina.1
MSQNRKKTTNRRGKILEKNTKTETSKQASKRHDKEASRQTPVGVDEAGTEGEGGVIVEAARHEVTPADALPSPPHQQSASVSCYFIVLRTYV